MAKIKSKLWRSLLVVLIIKLIGLYIVWYSFFRFPTKLSPPMFEQKIYGE